MKTITWDTNVNGKLDCNRFAHIDLAPVKMPTLHELDQTLITIQVADKSHQPVTVKLDSIVPFPLTQLSNIHTWPSHGMDSAQFIELQHRKKPVSKETQFAVYYYRKVDVN
jgi:hypothetical protein